MRQRPPALHREPLALLELAQLLADPIYYGEGMPKGDGRAVVVLPGLFANDLYLYLSTSGCGASATDRCGPGWP